MNLTVRSSSDRVRPVHPVGRALTAAIKKTTLPTFFAPTMASFRAILFCAALFSMTTDLVTGNVLTSSANMLVPLFKKRRSHPLVHLWRKTKRKAKIEAPLPVTSTRSLAHRVSSSMPYIGLWLSRTNDQPNEITIGMIHQCHGPSSNGDPFFFVTVNQVSSPSWPSSVGPTMSS